MAADAPEVITRAEAKAGGLRHYFTGKPCRRGGVGARLVSTGACCCNACAEIGSIRAKRWVSRNQQRSAEIKRQYRDRNADAVRARDRLRVSANIHRWKIDLEKRRASGRERSKRYAKLHPERDRARSAHRRAVLAGAKQPSFGDFDIFVIEEAFEAARRRRAMTGIDWHVDHMVPLSRGGAHAWHNIQVIPAEVNVRKRNRLIYTEPGQWLDFYGS